MHAYIHRGILTHTYIYVVFCALKYALKSIYIIYMYIHACIPSNTCIHYTCARINTYLHTYIHPYLHSHTYIIPKHTHTCTHAYIYAYTHTERM